MVKIATVNNESNEIVIKVDVDRVMTYMIGMSECNITIDEEQFKKYLVQYFSNQINNEEKLEALHTHAVYNRYSGVDEK